MEMDLRPSGRVNVLGHSRTHEEKGRWKWCFGAAVVEKRAQMETRLWAFFFSLQQLGSHLLHLSETHGSL